MQLNVFKLNRSIPFTMGSVGLTLLLSACTSSGISPAVRGLAPPDTYAQQPETGQRVERLDISTDQWLLDFADDELNDVVVAALVNNYRLVEQAARLEESRQGVVIAGADRYPELSAGAGGSARRTVVDDRLQQAVDSYDADFGASWEFDVWGKLRDNQKQATMAFAANEASYIDQRLALVSDTGRAWYQMIADRQLLDLFNLRLRTLEQDLEIINSRYRAGLNGALDVYLASNSLEQERARVAQQRQSVIESVSNLQLLVADYPDGQWLLERELPVINEPIPLGIPTDLLTRRPDVQQSWYNLLSADLSLAVAHKQRFPRLTINASLTDDADHFGDLLARGSLAQSLIGNLTLPLFQGGRLVSVEEQARQRVVQAEQQYLNIVNNAFSEVERAISRQARLQRRYDSFIIAEQNAAAAYELSFEQYQSGLTDFQTVLESQRRAFDSQSTVIDLRNQLLQNRIVLHQALGGNFGEDLTERANTFRIENKQR